jgi:hypothetical protein
VEALYPYDAASMEDLSFEVGDVIEVLVEQVPGWPGWSVGFLRGDHSTTGFFPDNFVARSVPATAPDLAAEAEAGTAAEAEAEAEPADATPAVDTEQAVDADLSPQLAALQQSLAATEAAAAELRGELSASEERAAAAELERAQGERQLKELRRTITAERQLDVLASKAEGEGAVMAALVVALQARRAWATMRSDLSGPILESLTGKR